MQYNGRDPMKKTIHLTLTLTTSGKKTIYSYEQPFFDDLHYRLLHYSIKANDYIHKYSNENKPNCDYCRIKEDNLHLLTKCARIQKIWEH